MRVMIPQLYIVRLIATCYRQRVCLSDRPSVTNLYHVDTNEYFQTFLADVIYGQPLDIT